MEKEAHPPTFFGLGSVDNTEMILVLEPPNYTKYSSMQFANCG